MFADDGISGTGIAKRDEFKRMIETADNGEIDIILTKSIQRFAKNTVDFLQKKMKKNEGEVPQYYVEGNHEAIISPQVFDMVQTELEKRKKDGTRYSGDDKRQTPHVTEDEVKTAFISAYNKLLTEKKEITVTFRDGTEVPA